MKNYLLDTDILIDYFKNQVKSIALLQQLQNNAHFFISSLTVSELRTGWSDDEAREMPTELYDIATVIPVTTEIAELAGAFRYQYRKKGKILPSIDTLIAATCILNDYCLVTRNLKDYPMPDLQIYKGIDK